MAETKASAVPRPRHREVVGRLASSQKSSSGAPAYSRFVNRPWGRQFAAIAFRLGMTPNQVTAISGLCSLLGIGLVAVGQPSWLLGVLVAFCLMTGYALDSADGQLARLKGVSSVAGEWLDHTVDAAKIVLLHLAVAVLVARTFPGPLWWALVPLAYTAVACVHFFTQILNDQIRRWAQATRGVEVARRPPSTFRSLAALPTDYGLLCVVFALLGAPTLFLAAYGLALVGTTGYLLLALRSWFKGMKALDATLSAREGTQ